MARKIIIIVSIALLFVFTVGIFAFTGFASVEIIKLVKPEDIYIPKNMKSSNFGLFFYNPDGTRVSTTENNVPFDPTKPVVIFSHGLSLGFGIETPEEFVNYEGWLNAGYNVGVFMWSQISDDDPYICEKKVWGGVDNRFAYNDENMKRTIETEDVTNYSMAEIFVAYYIDFMSKQNFTGREIHFEGLSLGAQLTMANCSYLLALNEAGLIGKEFLPDRVTLFDAFFTNRSYENIRVPWLKRSIGKDGTVALALETAKQLKKKGIAMEYIASSIVNITTAIGEGDKGNILRLYDETAFLDYSSDWYSIFEQDKKHIIGRRWYNGMIDYPIPMDDAISGQFAISPKVPTSYIFARMGEKYDMAENLTFDPTDDIYFSTGIIVPTVAGFVFEDRNENGNYDERLNARLSGITVELYLKSNDSLIGTAVTGEGGAYLMPIEPIYITAGANEFYVKVKASDGYGITTSKGTADFLMMANDIGLNYKSDAFTIDNTGELKIINVGLIKKISFI